MADENPRKERVVVIREGLVALTGHHISAILLGQLLYWQDRVRDVDDYLEEESARRSANKEAELPDIKTHGWIYKSAQELADDTMLKLTRQTVGVYLKQLVDAGWIAVRRNPRFAFDKTLQYRCDIPKIQDSLHQIGYVLNDFKLHPMTNITAIESRKSDTNVENLTAIPESTSEKVRQPAPSVPLASLATQTPRAGGVVPLGGASAKPKAPPIDPNVVIAKIREAKDDTAFTLESKECWTACLAIWESLYERKMNEADKKMFGGIIKDTSLELVGRTFVELLDGDILPPDWPYIIACVTSKRNKDAYKQVKKDRNALPIHDYYEVDVLDQRYGFGIYKSQYFRRINDEGGNPILNSQGHTQFQQLKPFPRFNQ